MRELSEIIQANAEAQQRAIPKLLLAGNAVVAEFAGLNFVGTHTVRNADFEKLGGEVDAKVKEVLQNAGASVVVYLPAISVAYGGDEPTSGKALALYQDGDRGFMSPVEA